jgi:hypothetical protein
MDFGQLVDKPSLELARLDDELAARCVVDNADADAALGYAVPELRSEEVLYLVAREDSYSG